MNQQDKIKLLELAALAGGIQFRGYDLWYEDFSAYDPEMDCNYQWNPLDKSEDALELAATLRLKIIPGKHKGDGCTVESREDGVVSCTAFGKTPASQMRLAITRVAANTGEVRKGRK